MLKEKACITSVEYNLEESKPDSPEKANSKKNTKCTFMG